MNLEKVKKTILVYKKYLNENNQSNEDLNNRKERIAYYQKFNKESLLKLEEEAFVEYIGNLWASSMYGSKKYLVDKMVANNSSFENLKNLLADFIYGEQNLSTRWDKFFEKAKFFGPSYMSEILGYVYPESCALANNQVVKALDYLEVKDVPHYNYQFTGKKYLEICEIMKKLATELKNNGVQCENLLAVDYYLWEVTRLNSDETLKVVDFDSKKISTQEKGFIHKELQDKIVQIGSMLGFEASSEVKVGNGAIVDAIWNINIGNMGRIMYAFEIQVNGSTDSALLNLQKASANKAVQAIIAISNDEQLQKIKREIEGIPALSDLKLWNYKDVLNAYDLLNTAMTSINALGLVPKGF